MFLHVPSQSVSVNPAQEDNYATRVRELEDTLRKVEQAIKYRYQNHRALGIIAATLTIQPNPTPHAD
jgi:hypothetical protein